MDIAQETNWYAVQTKPFRENLAVASVAKLDVDVFFPKIRQEQLVCGISRIITKPLFVGYFFARFCPSLLLDSIRYTSGIIRVVGASHFPIPVDSAIIANI